MKKLTFVILTLLLTGCFWWGLMYEERIAGNYYLVAIDAKSDMFVSYKDGPSDSHSGITSLGVRAVWNNDRYIIVRSYKYFEDSVRYKNLNPKSIEFYIIDMKSKDKRSYLGPYSEQKYKEEKKKLNITEEIVFRELFPEEDKPKTTK